MDINRKKVLLIPLDNALTDGGGLTDFHIHREVLDRIRSLNISHVFIIVDKKEDRDFRTKVKTIEFFVFSYCHTAVTAIERNDLLMDDVMTQLPHNIRRKEVFLCVGERFGLTDYISVEDFIGR